MLRIISKEIFTWSFLVVTVMLWCGAAIGADTFSDHLYAGEAAALYNNLGQTIEEEASIYSEYSHYRETLRLQVFRGELERLNLKRDDIILKIGLLETELKRQVPETSDATLSAFPATFNAQSGVGERFFANWRPFYFLISGGFLLIITSLLLMAICVTCRRDVTSFLLAGFKNLISDDIESMTKMASYDCCDYDILHKTNAVFKKAA